MNNTNNLIEIVVSTNKCTKVVKGGKNLSFAVLVVVGDKNGRANFAIGKAREVADAKNKAFAKAKKRLRKVPLKEGRTVHHDAEGLFASSKVIVRSAPEGTGIIAGGVMRSVFDALGIKDIVAKAIGTSNPYNVVCATFNALINTNQPKSVADRRKKTISEITRRKNKLLNIDSNVNKNDEEKK